MTKQDSERRPTQVPPQEVPEKCVLKNLTAHVLLYCQLKSAALPRMEVLREAYFKRKRECLPNTKTLSGMRATRGIRERERKMDRLGEKVHSDLRCC